MSGLSASPQAFIPTLPRKGKEHTKQTPAMSASKRNYTRFIPREEVGDVTRWQFGSVDSQGWEPPQQPQQPKPQPTAATDEPTPPSEPAGPSEQELQALIQQAADEAHQRGLEDGLQQAQEQAQQEMDDYLHGQGAAAAKRLEQVAQRYEASLGEMQQFMAQEVLALACDIARQVVRRELAQPAQAMLPVVREALETLQNETRPATVRLHPDDWALLEAPLRQQFPAARIQWQADTSVQPGDCMVESAGMVVDGTLDKRWRRAIAALGLTQAWKEVGHDD